MTMKMWKKMFVCAILIFLFSWNVTVKGKSTTTLYVDDDGTAEYTHIQDALNDAESGDTIFVYDGVYHENIVIDKTLITLQGQSQGGTIIDGGGNGDVITVTASSVRISTFTIRNGGIDKGVHLSSTSFCKITHCTIYGNGVGIMFDCASNNIVTYCTLRQNEVYGAQTYGCSPSNNTIHHNNFMENNRGNANDRWLNSWDDGSEGNYWDDYDGSDANGDGIGDTPYDIPGGNNKDNFPLMEPLDDEAPITTYSLSGNLGSGGWYISNVEVTLRAVDAGTGVEETKYKIDNGNWKVYTSPFNLNTDGIHTLSYYSTDKKGNEENVHSLTIKIDKTDPVVGIIKPQNRLYLFDREIIPTAIPIIIGKITIEADVSDAFSGVDKVSLYIGNELKKTFDNEPYEWEWNEPAFGTYNIKITAVDKASQNHVGEKETTVVIYNV